MRVIYIIQQVMVFKPFKARKAAIVKIFLD